MSLAPWAGKFQEIPAPPQILPAPGSRAMLNVESCKLSQVTVMQYLNKLHHDFRHEISFHLIYAVVMFYHNFLLLDSQISCHCINKLLLVFL